MKVSSSQISSVAVSLTLWLNLASAHPYHHNISPCEVVDLETIISQLNCGDDDASVQKCVALFGSDEHHLKHCLIKKAGCTPEQAAIEADWASKRCQGQTEEGQEMKNEAVEEVAIELREVAQIEKRDTTTSSTESSTTSTSSSSTATSTSDSTSTTASTTATSTDSSSTSSTATSSSSSSSTTASSTSSSTASSTSSTASSTSTSTSQSAEQAFGAWVYIIAIVLGLSTAMCIGCIGYRCCAERNARTKAAKLADEKEALALMKTAK